MIKNSELILNPDGSVYHLGLKPQDIAVNIILVGDQYRVEQVAAYFDEIEFTKQKREFKTQTGTFNGVRISVISTGIGPGNIDIVMNELDALVNIDFDSRTVKNQLTSLNIIRVGTSGSLQADIPSGSFVISEFGIGLDNMLRFYQVDKISNLEIEDSFISQMNWDMRKGRPYVVSASQMLARKFKSKETFEGLTGTASGFYGPQGRVLRIEIEDPKLECKMHSFVYKGIRMTNLDMETSAIYGFGKLFGHECISLNAILANRESATFTEYPIQVIDRLIKYTLDKLTQEI
jgi:uridine phosphorylase